MEKLNRAQKCSILGPQNLGSRESLGPRAPVDSHLSCTETFSRDGGEGGGGAIRILCKLTG